MIHVIYTSSLENICKYADVKAAFFDKKRGIHMVTVEVENAAQWEALTSDPSVSFSEPPEAPPPQPAPQPPEPCDPSVCTLC
jgi:hypothetical protein